MRAPFPFLLLVLVALLVAAGCGDDADGGSGDGAAAIEHLHVDGTVAVDGDGDGDGFRLTAADGEEYEFTHGPEVQAAEVTALAAAGSEARVTFRPTEGTPVAAEISEKPDKEGLGSYEGQVLRVTATELVVGGDDGERSFSIAGTDHAAFDPEHLEEHREREEPIVVYFDPKAPGAGIAYEDA